MNQLTVIDNHANVEAYRASTNAAEMCKEIVVATSSTIQGRRFVSVEGWQALAVAHGCVLSARDVERVEGGVRAIGEVRRMTDGQIIATGEGFVGEDEPTWYGGDNGRGRTLPKRADYAIRAMAQTRAMSRAGRTAFAHVVVMMKAGLATTPAEEVPFEGFDRDTGEVCEQSRSGPAPRTKLDGPHTSKTALRNAVFEIVSKVRKSETVEEIDALKNEGKRTINQALRDWPELINGEPDIEEDGGLKGAIDQRRAELTGEDNAVVTGLIQSMKQCETSMSLTNWRAANEEVIDALDGAEGRRFELAWNFHESAIREVEKVHN
jgi:hypothetical protein